MKKIILALLLIAIVLATSSCKKEAIDRDKKDTTGWNVK